MRFLAGLMRSLGFGAPEPIESGAMLDRLSRDNPGLNVRTSVVDLCKALGMGDLSREDRRHLATGLGYRGVDIDSTVATTWLYWEIVNRVAANGGVVPDELL